MKKILLVVFLLITGNCYGQAIPAIEAFKDSIFVYQWFSTPRISCNSDSLQSKVNSIITYLIVIENMPNKNQDFLDIEILKYLAIGNVLMNLADDINDKMFGRLLFNQILTDCGTKFCVSKEQEEYIKDLQRKGF